MHMTNEQKLVLLCVASRYAGKSGNDVKHLLDEKLDWRTVLLESQWHGVLPAVYNELRRSFVNSISSEALKLLGDAFEVELKRGMLMTSILFSILDEFDNAGIEVIPYKGPVFADRYYGSIAQRSFWDLDLLLRRKDIQLAKKVMLNAGYVPEELWSKAREWMNMKINCEYNFDKAGILIELHWGFVRKYIRFGMDVDSVFDGAETTKLLGRPVKTLAPDSRFLIMCAHNGVKHHWHRLRMITDLAMILEKDISLAWPEIVEEGRRLGLLCAIRTGAELARTLLGLELPDEFTTLIEEDNGTTDFTARLKSMMFSERENPPHAFTYHKVSLMLRERFLDRLRFLPHLIKEATFPTDKEERLIPGSGLFVTLGRIVIRPFRLLAKYATSHGRSQTSLKKRRNWR